MTKQEIEKYAEEKAQEFKEQIIKELSEKIEQEQKDKPYLIKKGEKYFVGEHRFATINEGNQQNYTDNLDIVAPTMDNYYEQLRARRLQREYELWCLKYPVNWEDENCKKYYAMYNYKEDRIIYHLYKKGEELIQGVVYCAEISWINAFIRKVGEEAFKKYILGIGLKKYWLEV